MKMSEDEITRPRPLPPVQMAYYLVSMINTILLLIVFIFGFEDSISFLMLLLVLAISLILIGFGTKLQPRNPWLNYTQFLRNKEANLLKVKMRAESAKDTGWRDLNLRLYRRLIGVYIADLKQFKILALSESRTEIADDLDKQIIEWRNILEQATKNEVQI